MKKKEMEGHGYTFIDQIRRAKKMNNTLEKELNEYREDLQELTNNDLLIEYKYSCIEVERLIKIYKTVQIMKSKLKKFVWIILLVEWGVYKNCRENGERNLFEERIFTRFKIYERRKLK